MQRTMVQENRGLGRQSGATARGRRARARAFARVALLGLALGLLALLAGTHPGRTAVRTLFFLPEMFPSTPLRPLTWISAAPRCEELTLPYADTEAIGDLCYPAGTEQHGGIVLSLGVHPLDRQDPFLVRLTDGLARTNMAVLRVQSPDLSAGRIVTREVDGLVAAFRALQGRSEVDPARVGLAGFSVGGSMSTVAAADPRIRDDVRLVYSFGGYYDAFAVLGAISDGYVRDGAVERAWTPHPWTVHVFAEQIVGALPEGEERDYLTALLQAAHEERDGPDWEPPALPLPLSTVGQMVYDLVVGDGRVDGAALLAALPPATRDTFGQLSPAAHVAGLRAPLFVMHDVGDTLIPYTESRRLVESLPPDVPRRYDEFHMFEHVYPRDPLAVLGFLPDLARLYGHLYSVLLLVTD